MTKVAEMDAILAQAEARGYRKGVEAALEMLCSFRVNCPTLASSAFGRGWHSAIGLSCRLIKQCLSPPAPDALDAHALTEVKRRLDERAQRHADPESEDYESAEYRLGWREAVNLIEAMERGERP